MLKSKEDIIYAIKKDWYLLENTAEYFRDDRELVIYALELDANFIFQYASDSIKNDMEIALTAVDCRCGLEFIGETIRRNPSFIIEVARKIYPYQLFCSPIHTEPFKKTDSKSFQALYQSALNHEIDIEITVNDFFKANTDLLIFQMGCSMIETLKSNPQILTNRIGAMRDQIFKQYEIENPKIRIQINPILPNTAYQFMIQGVIVDAGTISQSIPDSIDIMTKVIQESIKKNIDTIIQYQDAPAIMSKE